MSNKFDRMKTVKMDSSHRSPPINKEEDMSNIAETKTQTENKKTQPFIEKKITKLFNRGSNLSDRMSSVDINISANKRENSPSPISNTRAPLNNNMS